MRVGSINVHLPASMYEEMLSESRRTGLPISQLAQQAFRVAQPALRSLPEGHRQRRPWSRSPDESTVVPFPSLVDAVLRRRAG